MKIVNTISELRAILEKLNDKTSVGFVPTMGALHEGHLSLVRQSVEGNDYTVASIFVNPTQFNDKSDLEKYPRNLQRDCNLLKSAGCNFVFAPTVEEMYPVPDTRMFNFGELENVMEGKFRPGHFNGVGQIVSKLFDIVEPTRAYFGLKDFQQLAVIKKLVRDYDYKVEIIPCAILREADGLAMSSRNMLLENKKREAAPFIYEMLKKVASNEFGHTPDEIKKGISKVFSENSELDLEYFEIVEDKTLKSINEFRPEVSVTACIAVYAGKIRLIDNIQIIS